MPTLNPSPSGFQFRVTKNTKTPPGAGASILPLVVIGYCSNTTDAPVATPQPFSTPDAVETAGTTGDAVELAACALDDNGQVDLVHLVNSGGANAGTYGAITNSFAHGTPPQVEADSVVLPAGTFDVAIAWTTGFVLGVTGGKYRISLDGGLHYFAEQELGTATSITLPNGAGKINLVPPAATLYAWANDLATKLNAHAAYTTGSVHGMADPNAPYTFTTATTPATLYTLCGELKTHALNHVDELATVHGIADATATAGITALSAPTTIALAFAFLTAFQPLFFGTGAVNTGHVRRTTSSIHGGEDTTNLPAAVGTYGTVTTDDTTALSVEGPTPDATQLVAAIDSLRAYTGQFGTLTFAAPIPAGQIATVYAALKELWKYNKFSDVVASFDVPGLAESNATYAARLLADLTSVVAVDFRVCSGATYHQSALILTADGAATPRRPTSWAVAMAKATSEPQTDLQKVPLRGVRIRNTRGTAVLPGCLDEQSGSLYSVNARTIGTRTEPTDGGVYVTQDLVLYDANSDWVLGPYTSVVNHALRTGAPVVRLASSAPDGFPGFDQEVIDALVADVLAVINPEIVGKRRAKEVRFSITDTSGGKLTWKMVVVPNDYIINGVELEASVLLTREV